MCVRCSPLDDRFAVFGSGDEIALDFDPAKLPPLPKGWTRDYFFLANGYEKDMDFYAAEGDTVHPMPFRSMGTYPYPEGKSFPLDGPRDYMLNYNTRHMSGNEPQGISFDYPAVSVILRVTSLARVSVELRGEDLKARAVSSQRTACAKGRRKSDRLHSQANEPSALRMTPQE